MLLKVFAIIVILLFLPSISSAAEHSLFMIIDNKVEVEIDKFMSEDSCLKHKGIVLDNEIKLIGDIQVGEDRSTITINLAVVGDTIIYSIKDNIYQKPRIRSAVLTCRPVKMKI
jgi:hypothetical protein